MQIRTTFGDYVNKRAHRIDVSKNPNCTRPLATDFVFFITPADIADINRGLFEVPRPDPKGEQLRFLILEALNQVKIMLPLCIYIPKRDEDAFYQSTTELEHIAEANGGSMSSIYEFALLVAVYISETGDWVSPCYYSTPFPWHIAVKDESDNVIRFGGASARNDANPVFYEVQPATSWGKTRWCWTVPAITFKHQPPKYHPKAKD